MSKNALIPFLFMVIPLFSGCAAIWDDNPHPGALPPHSEDVLTRRMAGPDPGSGGAIPSLHFSVEGYGETPFQTAELAEKIYNEVMTQTALYSFKPKESYRIVIYKDKREFIRKTGQPEWSGGLNTGRDIFSYEQPGLQIVLAHEISHLIFSEFLEGKVKYLRWLNEGLAMNIEVQFNPYESPDIQKAEWERTLRNMTPLTMSDIADFNPYHASAAEVDLWYKASASLTEYLLRLGGAYNFSLFLKEIKSGYNVDEALQRAYPGKILHQEDLFRLWMSTR